MAEASGGKLTPEETIALLTRPRILCENFLRGADAAGYTTDEIITAAVLALESYSIQALKAERDARGA